MVIRIRDQFNVRIYVHTTEEPWQCSRLWRLKACASTTGWCRPTGVCRSLLGGARLDVDGGKFEVQRELGRQPIPQWEVSGSSSFDVRCRWGGWCVSPWLRRTAPRTRHFEAPECTRAASRPCSCASAAPRAGRAGGMKGCWLPHLRFETDRLSLSDAQRVWCGWITRFLTTKQPCRARGV